MLLTPIKPQYTNAPVGAHHATFDGITPIETQNGKAYRWAFKLEKDGSTISVLSDAERPPTMKNKTGRFLSALTGASLVENVEVNTDNFVGKRYLVIVVPDGEKTKVETFSKIG